LAYAGVSKESQMEIGKPRRTIYIEPIEEPDDAPIEEPSPELDPLPDGQPEPAPPAR
jgi:hypothetical protein